MPNSMKQLFCLLLIAFSACSQTHPQTTFFTTLSGTIDTLPITLQIRCTNHQCAGYYYYHSKHQPIEVWGTDTGTNGKLTLMANEKAGHQETFVITLDGTTARGTWQNDDHKAHLPVSLHETHMPVAFTFMETEDTMSLRASMPQSPVAFFKAGTIWPVGNSDLDEWLKNEIRKQLGDSSAGNISVTELLDKQKNSFFQSYLDINKNATEEELQQSKNTFSYSEYSSVEIAYYTPDLLAMRKNTSNYTGGAHDNYAVVVYFL